MDMRRHEPELIVDPAPGGFRPESKLTQILRIVLAACVIAAIFAGAFLLIAGLFTVLAFVVPVLLLAGLVYVLVNRRRGRTVIIRRG